MNSYRLEDINEKVIKEYLTSSQVERGWQKYTYWTQYKNLKAFFNWRTKEGIATQNPFDKVPHFKQPDPLPKALQDTEIAQLIEIFNSLEYEYEFTRLRDKALLLTFLLAGLRRKELVDLKVTDVDIINEMLYVQHGKGDKYRDVPIQAEDLKPALIEYLEYKAKIGKTSEWFFNGTFSNRGKNNNKLTYAAIYELFRKIKIEMRKKVGPHILRHSFATLFLNQTDNIGTLKDIMGHNKISTTEIYTKIVRKKKVELINKLQLPTLSA